MKRLTTLFTLLFMSVALLAQDAVTPSPREIGDAYIEMIGGKDAWLAVKATTMQGTAGMGGMEFPMTITTAEGDKMRLSLDIQGSPMTQTYDGTTGYILFPMQGITEPKQMSEEEAADLANSPFLSEFIDSEARGFTLTAVEGKEIEGTPTYGVKVTNDEGYDRTYYFDTETMVPIMAEQVSQGGQMKGMIVESYMSDYQEVEDLMIPMYMEQKANGQTLMQMTFTEVKINPEVQDSMFILK
ncbi:hypothetical protein LEM8419_00882 [Neolewinella maritima]|uniref:Outer membrane lipoprotein-sorting protein n=1 Tax=Neolewinella maritima TaxID=1383882 RepID=A0ABM9AXZ3_9BACT|nr:hypothetical protein [Neolewinella maritima]CAH0999582.1 hypothetical protein LEM8419_00882 [Neolewinella maritima]